MSAFRFNVTSAFALLALLASGCGDPADPSAEARASATQPIIGGTLVDDGEFPAVVALGGCTGTLVRPDFVVYAAHCGTAMSQIRFGASSDAPERVIDTERCRAFPGAKLGDGTDLAYCILETPVLDIQPERILAGCELSEFAAGDDAIIVGYGKDNEAGAYGQKRFAAGRVESIGDEIFLESGPADTCRGDSGGPVFIERRDADGTLQRRLVGVTSAGTESECGRGVAHYVNISRKLDWLETSSQLDLTPCFSGEDWSPNATCQASTCGDPFVPAEDADAPSLRWSSPVGPHLQLPLPSGAEFVELELTVEAADAGWGVEQVELSLLASDGEVLFRRADGFAPYGLPTLRVPPGDFTLRAEARDFAGNRSRAHVTLRIGDVAPPWLALDGRGCASLSRAAPRASGLACVGVLLFACAAVRRRSRRR